VIELIKSGINVVSHIPHLQSRTHASATEIKRIRRGIALNQGEKEKRGDKNGEASVKGISGTGVGRRVAVK